MVHRHPTAEGSEMSRLVGDMARKITNCIFANCIFKIVLFQIVFFQFIFQQYIFKLCFERKKFKIVFFKVGGRGGREDHEQGHPLSSPRHRRPSSGPQMRARKAEQDGEGLQKMYSKSSIPGLSLTAYNLICEG